MKNIPNVVRKFINRCIIEEEYKYSLLLYSIAAVHIILVVLFCFLHIFPLILFNIASVIIYLSCAGIIRQGGQLIKIFYITYLEIIVHSFVATICIGWRFGFPQYIIALIPFGYYMCYNMVNGHKKYFVATLLGVVAFVSFIGCRMISMFSGSVYQLEVSATIEIGIYIFNSICTFIFLLFFSLIFVLEMQAATNKLRSQNAILDKLASTDPLTGLYNRRSMQIFLNHALESKTDFCLVMCDIDDFKKVNDTYGHESGDIVLKEISTIIQQQVEEYDYVCRWGGEEILILSSNSLEHTCQIAENIRRIVENHIFYFGEKFVHCSLTLGVTIHKSGDTIEETINQADTKLYYGKRHGKNRVIK